MLSLSGVPGIYIHSLFGSPNSHESVKKTGRVRSINREKFHFDALENKLKDKTSRTSRVFTAYTHYLKIRKEHPAFKPLAPQLILDLGDQVFTVLRTSADEREMVLCLINITSKPVKVSIAPVVFDLSSNLTDLLTGDEYSPGGINLEQYQVLWLKED